MQLGQLERYRYKWVSAYIKHMFLRSHQCYISGFNRHVYFLHPQDLRCSLTLPWCCTNWWRSLTDQIPQRLFWRTQVPLCGSADQTSQPATHREVLSHSGPFEPTFTTVLRVSLPLSQEPQALQALLVSPKHERTSELP